MAGESGGKKGGRSEGHQVLVRAKPGCQREDKEKIERGGGGGRRRRRKRTNT